jgi:hypothetical protein
MMTLDDQIAEEVSGVNICFKERPALTAENAITRASTDDGKPAENSRS